MRRIILTWFTGIYLVSVAHGQTMTLSTASDDYVVTNTFSVVNVFDVEIEIDRPLAPGVYIDPPIISVSYQVVGERLEPGTPSGFPAFDLRRGRAPDAVLDGFEFYAQGGSLSFEISQGMDLSDGVQADELAGEGVVLTFNAREVGTPRFHPPLFELNADGTGRIQNSNNMPIRDNEQIEVAFGAEYITDLIFDPGNTTIIIATPLTFSGGSSGGGCFIATAAYGSYLEPQVQLLRAFRDEYLLSNVPGRAFVDWYYRNSPPLAEYIAQREWLRGLTRGALTPLVYGIRYPGGSAILLILLCGSLVYFCVRKSGRTSHTM